MFRSRLHRSEDGDFKPRATVETPKALARPARRRSHRYIVKFEPLPRTGPARVRSGEFDHVVHLTGQLLPEHRIGLSPLNGRVTAAVAIPCLFSRPGHRPALASSAAVPRLSVIP